MTNLIVNGVSYPYPQEGDSAPWGSKLTNWASAVTSGMLQKSGGTFTLTADVDFGASFGLKSAYFKSRTANIASSGQLRLANADVISWRNAGNTGNLPLGVDSNELLTLNGVPVGMRVFNVQTFGALGNGTHDDTVAIQAAVTTASNYIGATVYIPGVRTNYKTTDTIVIAGNTPIRIIGDGPSASQIRFAGSNTVPMFTISTGLNGCEMANLHLTNDGSATIGVQVNATKVFLHNLYSVSPKKFSTAFISTYQADSYTYYTVIRDCFAESWVSGEETPVMVLVGGGNSLIIDGCFFAAFSEAGVKYELDGLGGNVLGTSITNSHFESFAGDDPSYPGSHTAVGIYADGVFGLNITGNCFMMNGTAVTAANAQRGIALYAVQGANIQGNLFFNTGHGSSVSIRSSGAKDILVEGNTFYDQDSGIETTTSGSSYYVGPNNAFNTTTLVSDSYAPPAASGIIRLANTTGTLSWRNAANSADLSLITDSNDRLYFTGKGFQFRNDQSAVTRGIIMNGSSNASASAKFTVSAVDDFDFVGTSSGGGSNASITAQSGYTGGLQITSVAGTLKLRTASSDRLTITNGGQVAISGLNYPTSDGTSNQFLKTNGSGTLSFGSVSTSIAVVAKTANYTLTTSNDLVTGDVSGGAFTLTLPTAVGNTGKIFTIKRTDQTLGTALTVNTTSSQTIDGALTFKLMTQYESLQVVSDGANWQIIEHSIPSDATTFTMVVTGTTSNPTFNASPTLNVATWKRVGDSIQIRYQYQQTSASGTAVGSGNYLFALPSGLTIDTAKLPVAVANNNCVGSAFVSNAADLTSASSIIANVVAYDSSHLAIRILSSTTTAALVSSSAAAANNGNLTYAFEATVPVTNWKG